jgi:hypothetical protein
MELSSSQLHKSRTAAAQGHVAMNEHMELRIASAHSGLHLTYIANVVNSFMAPSRNLAFAPDRLSEPSARPLLAVMDAAPH